MLVLSRRLGERILIGTGPDAVVIEVTEIDHGRVRLAFDAPRAIPIVREELLRQRPALRIPG